MADNATIEIKGLDERIKQFGEASTKNPEMRKRINEVIRAMMKEVRKKLQDNAQSGLQMKSDPRKAYKAIKMAVYRKIFGGNVSILSPRRAGTLRLYEPTRKGTRDPYGRGGNRMKRPKGGRTETMMSYTGGDRWMILQWLNAGTKARYSGNGRNGRTEAQYNKFILDHNGRGFRGSIGARNWFGPRSSQELMAAAANLDKMLDDIVSGILY
jgi:ribosomal protein S20